MTPVLFGKNCSTPFYLTSLYGSKSVSPRIWVFFPFYDCSYTHWRTPIHCSGAYYYRCRTSESEDGWYTQCWSTPPFRFRVKIDAGRFTSHNRIKCSTESTRILPGYEDASIQDEIKKTLDANLRFSRTKNKAPSYFDRIMIDEYLTRYKRFLTEYVVRFYS